MDCLAEMFSKFDLFPINLVKKYIIRESKLMEGNIFGSVYRYILCEFCRPIFFLLRFHFFTAFFALFNSGLTYCLLLLPSYFHLNVTTVSTQYGFLRIYICFRASVFARSISFSCYVSPSNSRFYDVGLLSLLL